MSTMLGEISAKELHGPWSDFMDKLQGNESALWFAAFKRFLRKENPWDGATKKGRTTITVKPNLTLTERIALGKYGWVNSDITEKMFPNDATTVGKWEFKLVHLNRVVSSEDAKFAVEVDGWTVAKAEHLLAFGDAFPEEQRKYPIIALGSVCNGDRVLELWLDTSKRGLFLYCWYVDWGSFSRFLVVRKMNSKT